jgi:5'-nucleotidase
MKIFLTNDDGIYAEGLWTLYKAFAENHSVTVIAPDRERSAVSHGITLHEPLRITRVRVAGGYSGYAVNGTPADCVKLGVLEVLDEKPDLVISGINPGANVGSSIHYSGTVAAAREAVLYGVPAIAVSLNGYEGLHYEDAAQFASRLAAYLSENPLPLGTFLNVNIPDLPRKDIAGVRITRQDMSLHTDYFEKRTDPRNRIYYWLGGDTRTFEESQEVDGKAISRNYISVTPVSCDTTDYKTLEVLKRWEIDA